MTIRFYDLAAADPAVRFSPNCWRTRMALVHKGLAFEAVPWRFTDKAAIAPSGQATTPVIVDGERWVADSWEIARYLDATYPERPLMADAQATAHAYFIKCWTETVVHPAILKQIMPSLFEILAPEDQAYFRESRERRFGMTLEDFAAGAAEALPAFRAALQPLRVTLQAQPFLGGAAPSFADYVVFGAFQWARFSSPHELLDADDPIAAWRGRLVEMAEGANPAAG